MNLTSKKYKNLFTFNPNYRIKENHIIVTHNKKEQKYKITQEKIKYYESLLLKQYKSLIDKQEEILQSKLDLSQIVYSSIAMCLCILSALSSEISEILGMFLCASGVMSLIICAIDDAIFSYKFKSKIKTYEAFIQERQNLETYLEHNESLTKKLTDNTIEILEYNKELKEQEIINNILTINFMDKASLQELRKILYIYSIHNKKNSLIEENPALKTLDNINKIKKRIKRK